MFRYLLLLAGLLLLGNVYAQSKKPQDFGFRHLNLVFEKDPVNVLILSQKGEEQKKKPIFLFIQDALPIPLIIYDEQGLYGTFPFDTDELLQHYHLAIIGKPFIPVVAETEQLQPNFTYLDPETEQFPEEYSERNQLDYYVRRNLQVIADLKAKPWVSDKQLVVAGHAEGSSIATAMSARSDDITHLIYSSGKPFVAEVVPADSVSISKDTLYYQSIDYVQLSSREADSLSETGKKDTTALSNIVEEPLESLKKLEIPVMLVYGSKGQNADDYASLQSELKRLNKENFTFIAYPELEQNYFGVTEEGEIDYDNYNWDRVAEAWLEWLSTSNQE